jgi:hypothetical protein
VPVAPLGSGESAASTLPARGAVRPCRQGFVDVEESAFFAALFEVSDFEDAAAESVEVVVAESSFFVSDFDFVDVARLSVL